MPKMAEAAPCGAHLVEQWIGYFLFIAQTYAVPIRFDADDCVQECCLELVLLMSEMDPTNPDFVGALKTRVFHKLIELSRAVRYLSRDFQRTVSLDEDLDFVEDTDHSLAVETQELESLIEKQLTPHQLILWRELVRPTRTLGTCFTAFRKQRRKTEMNVPISVYAAATGLSYRQVRHALAGIRSVARDVFSAESESCPC